MKFSEIRAALPSLTYAEVQRLHQLTDTMIAIAELRSGESFAAAIENREPIAGGKELIEALDKAA